MASFREIILRTVGDGQDARDDLSQTAAALKAFDGATAEAEALLDTSDVRKKVAETKKTLADLSKVEATPEVKLATAAAEARIRAFEARLAVLGAKSVDVDVDVNRGKAESTLSFLERLRLGASSAFSSVTSLFTTASQGAASFAPMGQGLSQASQGTGTLASIAGEAAAVLGIAVVGAIGAAVTALVALASSAAAAALALGALAVAAGALVLPFAALAGGAIARFKATADQAGTAANSLKTAATGLFDTFKKATAGGADAVFKGLAAGLRAMKPLVSSLAPAFTRFGQIAGGALKNLLTQLSSPFWRRFFGFLLRAAGQAVGPLSKAFLALARIFANIAQASMPFLIQGLKLLARWLGGVAKDTGNIGKLRSQIGGLVGHLSSWFNLAKQIGRVMIALFAGGASAGKGLVDTLAKGAQALADWMSSSKGQERIKQFFADVMPLVSQVATLIGQLGLVMIETFQALAPAITPFFQALNLLLKPVLFLLELFNKIPAPIRSWLIPIAGVFSMFSSFKSLVSTIAGLFPNIGSAGQAAGHALTSAFSAVGGVISKVAGWIAGAAKQLVVGPFKAGAAAIGGAIVAGFDIAKKIVGDVASFISGAVNKIVVAPFSKAASAIGRAIIAGISLAASIVSKVAQFMGNAAAKVASFVSSFSSKAATVGRNLVSGFVSGVQGLISSVASIGRDLANAIIDAVKGVLGISSPSRVFADIGRHTVEGFIKGLVSGNVLDVINHVFGGAAKLGWELIKAGAINVPKALAKHVFDILNPLHLPGFSLNTFGDALGIGADALKKVLGLGGGVLGDVGHAITHPGFASGVTDFMGGMAEVGEHGPELVNLPPGADVFSAARSRRMDSGGGVQVAVTAPPGEAPDVETFVAQIDQKLRVRGFGR